MSQDNSPDEVKERKSVSKDKGNAFDSHGPAGQASGHVDASADHNKAVGNEPVYPPESLAGPKRTKRRRKSPPTDQRAGLVQKPPGPDA